MIVDEAEEELELSPDPFLEAGIRIPPKPVEQPDAPDNVSLSSRASRTSKISSVVGSSIPNLRKLILKRGLSKEDRVPKPSETSEELTEILSADDYVKDGQTNHTHRTGARKVSAPARMAEGTYSLAQWFLFIKLHSY